MKFNAIANTDLKVSAVSLGTWVMGGAMWNGAKRVESMGAIKEAIARGVTLIDTAPIYGFGQAEEIVGKAIKGKRDRVVLVTKCGLIKKNNQISIDLTPESIRVEIDASLRRLDCDYIDIYLMHWPDPNTPIEKTVEEMVKIKAEGKIRHIGVSNFGLDLLKRTASLTDIAILQVQYSMLERSIERDVLPFCRDNKIGVMAYGTMAGGILTGKYKEPVNFQKGDARNFFYKYYQGKSFEKVQGLLKAMEKTGKPLNQTAINWVRQKNGVSTVIVGCRTAEQAEANIAAVDWELSDEQMMEVSA